MTKEFAGKVAMVTGAAGGIGRASALAFAARGAALVLCDVADVAETAALVGGHGVESVQAKLDVSDGAAVRAIIASAVEKFGRLDFAHNNAGITAIAPIADLEEADWRRVLDVNLTGVFLCMKYQLPQLIATQGAIVNTASVWASQGTGLMPAYVATKHGLAGLTRSAAYDYGRQGVRVNAVAPGPILTPMTSPIPEDLLAPVIGRTTLGRIGQPNEVGEAVAWLCSSAASYINGAILPVDGGYLVT